MSRSLVTVAAMAAFALGACRDAPEPIAPLEVPLYGVGGEAGAGGNFRAPLSGREEVPANTSRGTGVATFQLSADGETLHYKLIASNIENINQAHIHLAPKGSNGGVVVWLYPESGPPAAAPGAGRHNGVLAEGDITASNFVGALAGQPMSVLIGHLESGNAYVNVHTSNPGAPSGPGNIPPGEIRGQIFGHSH